MPENIMEDIKVVFTVMRRRLFGIVPWHKLGFKDADDRKFDETVAKFRDSESIDLREELALARAMCNEMADCTGQADRQKVLPAVRDTLKVIASLSAAEFDRRLRTSELLSKDALRRFSSEVCDVVVKELERSGLENWTDIADRIVEQLGQIAESTKNERTSKVNNGKSL